MQGLGYRLVEVGVEERVEAEVEIDKLRGRCMLEVEAEVEACKEGSCMFEVEVEEVVDG